VALMAGGRPLTGELCCSMSNDINVVRVAMLRSVSLCRLLSKAANTTGMLFAERAGPCAAYYSKKIFVQKLYDWFLDCYQ
jgi:hypothetical protein